jgi:hypothetical protein
VFVRNSEKYYVDCELWVHSLSVNEYVFVHVNVVASVGLAGNQLLRWCTLFFETSFSPLDLRMHIVFVSYTKRVAATVGTGILHIADVLPTHNLAAVEAADRLAG